MADNRVIGRRGKLPWRLAGEQQLFRRITMGKPVVMGRKTHQSIGRALDGRLNIVMTTNRNYRAKGCVVVHAVDEALHAASAAEEIMVIGGETLYRTFLALADRIYLTRVRATPQGDAFFPEIDEANWVEIRHKYVDPNEAPPLAYSCHILVRK